MERIVCRPPRLRGAVRVPGDKSISHRTALLGALASGTTKVRGYLAAADCRATLECLRALGVEWRLTEETPGVAALEIQGAGLQGLREPDDVLSAGNSGTTLRLLAGVLAGQPFASVITGDASLRSRPVDRIVTPLRQMGAHLIARDGDRRPPLTVRGGPLRGIRYRPPVASAQVKSAVLLAGLNAAGETAVEEPLPTRDHTERLLQVMGADVRREGACVRLSPPSSLEPVSVEIPGDISAAAFWLIAAAVHPESQLLLPKVGVNPTRSGLLDVLRKMGGSVDIGEERMVGGEPTADIVVSSSRLRGMDIGGEMIPRLIDELPALAVAAAFAEGQTVVRDATELRVKESDRIASLTRELRRMGAQIEERPDGFVIEGGGGLRGACVSGGGDHRLTMALAIAGLLAEGETAIQDGDSVAISYPGFWQDLERVTGS